MGPGFRRDDRRVRGTQCDVFSTTGKSLRFYGFLSSPSIKNILLYRKQNQMHNPYCPEPAEGRFAIVTIRRARDAMDATISGVPARFPKGVEARRRTKER